jgi:cell division protein FtsB
MPSAHTAKPRAIATRKRRWKYLLYATVPLFVGYFFIGGKDGLRQVQQQRLELAAAEERLAQQKVQRDSLALVLHRLQTDLDYIEKIAREQLGMVKKDEYLYYVRPSQGKKER